MNSPDLRIPPRLPESEIIALAKLAGVEFAQYGAGTLNFCDPDSGRVVEVEEDANAPMPEPAALAAYIRAKAARERTEFRQGRGAKLLEEHGAAFVEGVSAAFEDAGADAWKQGTIADINRPAKAQGAFHSLQLERGFGVACNKVVVTDRSADGSPTAILVVARMPDGSIKSYFAVIDDAMPVLEPDEALARLVATGDTGAVHVSSDPREVERHEDIVKRAAQMLRPRNASASTRRAAPRRGSREQRSPSNSAPVLASSSDSGDPPPAGDDAPPAPSVERDPLSHICSVCLCKTDHAHIAIHRSTMVPAYRYSVCPTCFGRGAL